MKDQIVSFETAKVAKEKGFNEDCYEHYHIREDDTVLADNEAGYLECTNLEDYLHSNEPLKDNEYSAPTQSLLQKWLREVHNIKLWNEFGYTKEWFCYYLNKYDDKIQLTTKLRNATYEEALEIGLQEALKFIKTQTNE